MRPRGYLACPGLSPVNRSSIKPFTKKRVTFHMSGSEGTVTHKRKNDIFVMFFLFLLCRCLIWFEKGSETFVREACLFLFVRTRSLYFLRITLLDLFVLPRKVSFPWSGTSGNCFLFCWFLWFCPPCNNSAFLCALPFWFSACLFVVFPSFTWCFL